jgi:hypothetical protein
MSDERTVSSDRDATIKDIEHYNTEMFRRENEVEENPPTLEEKIKEAKEKQKKD